MRDTDFVNNPSLTYFVPAFRLGDYKQNIFQYDWTVVLKRSGAVYDITIRYDDRTVKSPTNDGEYTCTDNVFYAVNGVSGVSQGFSGYGTLHSADIPVGNRLKLSIAIKPRRKYIIPPLPAASSSAPDTCWLYHHGAAGGRY